MITNGRNSPGRPLAIHGPYRASLASNGDADNHSAADKATRRLSSGQNRGSLFSAESLQRGDGWQVPGPRACLAALPFVDGES